MLTIISLFIFYFDQFKSKTLPFQDGCTRTKFRNGSVNDLRR